MSSPIRILHLEDSPLDAELIHIRLEELDVPWKVIRVTGKLDFENALRNNDFDLIFCDIDKAGYPAALPVIATKLRPGGLLITDNLLWHGRIFDAGDTTPETVAIREYTRLLTTSPDWITTLVPIRDGLMVAQRG